MVSEDEIRAARAAREKAQQDRLQARQNAAASAIQAKQQAYRETIASNAHALLSGLRVSSYRADVVERAKELPSGSPIDLRSEFEMGHLITLHTDDIASANSNYVDLEPDTLAFLRDTEDFRKAVADARADRMFIQLVVSKRRLTYPARVDISCFLLMHVDLKRTLADNEVPPIIYRNEFGGEILVGQAAPTRKPGLLQRLLGRE